MGCEDSLEALRREMLEETGIDTGTGQITHINTAAGEHEETLRDIGERLFVKMTCLSVCRKSSATY